MIYNYIAIEGNIGAGKTTLAKMLSEDMGSKLILEEFEENPFLPLFYRDPLRYGFQVELSFLAQRFEQIQRELINSDLFFNGFVSDYILQKCAIFAKHNLIGESLKLYHSLYKIINQALPQPELVIYLHRDPEVLLSNIAKRGRSYESEIDKDYLKGIQDGYLNFFKQCDTYPVLVIDLQEADIMSDISTFESLRELTKSEYRKGPQFVSL